MAVALAATGTVVNTAGATSLSVPWPAVSAGQMVVFVLQFPNFVGGRISGTTNFGLNRSVSSFGVAGPSAIIFYGTAAGTETGNAVLTFSASTAATGFFLIYSGTAQGAWTIGGGSGAASASSTAVAPSFDTASYYLNVGNTKLFVLGSDGAATFSALSVQEPQGTVLAAPTSRVASSVIPALVAMEITEPAQVNFATLKVTATASVAVQGDFAWLELRPVATQAPSPVTNITFSNVQQNSVAIYGVDPSPAVGMGQAFDIYQYVTSAGPGSAILATTTTALGGNFIGSLTAGTNYTFYIIARNPIGTAAASPTAAMTTSPLPPTALTLYQAATASTTLTTAERMFNVGSSSESNVATTVAKSTGYIELRSITAATVLTLGTPTATTPAPSGNGWILDDTSLEGQQIVAGTWTPSIKVASSTTATTAAFYVRVYKRSSTGVYTNIGFFTSAAAVVSTVAATPKTLANFTGNTSVPLMAFAVGDKIYLDVIAGVTVASGSLSGTISEYRTGGAPESLVTPGYVATPVVVPPVRAVMRNVGKFSY